MQRNKNLDKKRLVLVLQRKGKSIDNAKRERERERGREGERERGREREDNEIHTHMHASEYTQHIMYVQRKCTCTLYIYLPRISSSSAMPLNFSVS